MQSIGFSWQTVANSYKKSAPGMTSKCTISPQFGMIPPPEVREANNKVSFGHLIEMMQAKPLPEEAMYDVQGIKVSIRLGKVNTHEEGNIFLITTTKQDKEKLTNLLKEIAKQNSEPPKKLSYSASQGFIMWYGPCLKISASS